jgi:hypothetical protein
MRPLPRLVGRGYALLRRPRTLAVVGGTSLALALGVAFLPGLFPESVFRPLSAVVASPVAIVLFGALAGLLGAQALRESASIGDGEQGARSGRDRWQPRKAPEQAYYDEYRTAGQAVDAAFDADPDEPGDLDALRRTSRGRIREVAIAVIAADENVDRETAARRIAAGSWTDDPRAAAFVGGRRHAPLRTRIRDWASGERFERWAARAVDEIAVRKRGRRAERDADADRGRDATSASTDAETARETEVVRG